MASKKRGISRAKINKLIRKTDNSKCRTMHDYLINYPAETTAFINIRASHWLNRPTRPSNKKEFRGLPKCEEWAIKFERWFVGEKTVVDSVPEYEPEPEPEPIKVPIKPRTVLPKYYIKKTAEVSDIRKTREPETVLSIKKIAQIPKLIIIGVIGIIIFVSYFITKRKKK